LTFALWVYEEVGRYSRSVEVVVAAAAAALSLGALHLQPSQTTAAEREEQSQVLKALMESK
jgi:hypothetical protein